MTLLLTAFQENSPTPYHLEFHFAPMHAPISFRALVGEYLHRKALSILQDPSSQEDWCQEGQGLQGQCRHSTGVMSVSA